MVIQTNNLKDVLATLKSVIRLEEDMRGQSGELDLALRDSVIQRFEYTYELSVKLIQRWIAQNVNPEDAEPTYTRKELYRLAANKGLIADPLIWFKYHNARNVSAHTYNEANARQVHTAALELAGEVELLLQTIDRHND